MFWVVTLIVQGPLPTYIIATQCNFYHGLADLFQGRQVLLERVAAAKTAAKSVRPAGLGISSGNMMMMGAVQVMNGRCPVTT